MFFKNQSNEIYRFLFLQFYLQMTGETDEKYHEQKIVWSRYN